VDGGVVGDDHAAQPPGDGKETVEVQPFELFDRDDVLVGEIPIDAGRGVAPDIGGSAPPLGVVCCHVASGE